MFPAKTVTNAMVVVSLASSLAAAASFGESRLWDDGLAEVAHYQGKKQIYGKLWDHELVIVTVKEDFNEEYYVKADPPYGGKELLPVLKQNIFTRIQTKNYPYHYLISVFVRRQDVWDPVKMTVGSQEWCGNTFKEFVGWKRPAEFVYHSYFDRQGDGRLQIDLEKGDMLHEQLFLSLRALDFEEGLTKRFRLLDSQMTNKFKKPRWHRATLTVEGKTDIEAAGERVECWKVAVTSDSERMNFYFDEKFPHVLVRYEDDRGQELVLKEVSRRAYWE